MFRKFWYLTIKYLIDGETVPSYKRVADWSTSAELMLECELSELKHELDGRCQILGIVLREDCGL